MAIKTEDAFSDDELYTTEDAFGEPKQEQKKQPIRSQLGITGSYFAPSIDIGQSYGERVQSDIDEQARKDVERQEQGGIPALSTAAGAVQSTAAPLRQAPGAFELGQVSSGLMRKIAPKQPPPIPSSKTPTFGTFSMPPVDPGKMMQESPNLRSIVDIGSGSAEVLGAAYGGSKLAAPFIRKGLKTTEKALSGAGKSMLRSEMKPKDVTALLAGKNVEEGAKNLVDNIQKYDIQSPVGGFSGISKNAGKKISKNMDLSDAAIKRVAKETPGSSIDIDNSFIKFIDDLEQGKINSVFGDEARSADLANSIHRSLELRGLTGVQSIEKIPEIKKVISQYGGGLFKKGKFSIDTDPIKKQVGELAYLRLKEDLESFVPEIKQYNTAVHDLITIKKAADEATKRIGNRNKVGLTDWMILFGGPTAAQSIGLPSAAAGAIPGTVLIGKKALGSGRGASGLISAGKGIRNIRRIGETRITP